MKPLSEPLEILNFLDSRGISYLKFEHEPVFTCEQAAETLKNVPGLGTKNLFLIDRGGNPLLVTMRETVRADLKKLGEMLGVGKLSFGSAELLRAVLGVEPGSVTMLGLVNDRAVKVRLIVDRECWGDVSLQCHPLVNTATLVIAAVELRKFFAETGHAPEVVTIPEKAPLQPLMS